MAWRTRDYRDYRGALDIATASGDAAPLLAFPGVLWSVTFTHLGASGARVILGDNTATVAVGDQKLTLIASSQSTLVFTPVRPIYFGKGIMYFVTATGARVEVGYLQISNQ